MIEESRNNNGVSSEDGGPGRGTRPATRVLLADADGERRRRLRELLENSDSARLLVAAEASTRDPGSVLRRARSLRPEAVALGLGGVGDAEMVELAREFKGLSDPPKVVLFGNLEAAPELNGGAMELVLAFSLADAHIPQSRVEQDLAGVLGEGPA